MLAVRPARPVLPERRRAVGRRSATRREPRQPIPGPSQPGADLVPAAQPHRVRRHATAWRPRAAARRARRCRSARTPRRSGPAAPAARRRAAPTGRCRSTSVARAWPGPAAARCSPTRRVVSSSSATSVACQRSTSRRIRTARCRGGRCCSAATNASRIDSRATASSAGSPSSGSTRASGIGWTQVVLGRRGAARTASAAATAARGPSAAPGAAGRSSMSRQTFVAMRYSHERSAERPSKPVAARARPAPSSPARRPRPRTPSRASGSSSRSARRGTARARARRCRGCRRPGSGPRCRLRRVRRSVLASAASCGMSPSRWAPRTPHRTRPQAHPGPGGVPDQRSAPPIRQDRPAGAYRESVPLRTADDYRESLRDGRTLYYRGRRIEDVTAEPELRIAVEHAALDYDAGPGSRPRGPRHRQGSRHRRGLQRLLPDPPVDRGPAGAVAADRGHAPAAGGTMVTLIKEIGTDALFALQRDPRGRGAGAGPGLLPALPRRRPRRRRRPDRREGRPVARRRRPRPTRTSTCGSSTRTPTASSCGARRCTPRSAPTRTRSSCCRRGRWAPTTPTTRWPSPSRSTRPGLKLYVSSYAARRARHVRVPAVRRAQDARDAHRLRRRLRAVGARLRLSGD